MWPSIGWGSPRSVGWISAAHPPPPLGPAKRVKAKLLRASNSEVYGDPDIHPQPEHDWGNVNSIGQRACYDSVFVP
jgi:hypothetical protein